MRVLIVSQFFKPEPSIMPSRLAKEMAGDGHDVVVVTGFPNRPGGRLFTGYRQSFRHEEFIDGARVRRVPLIINHDRNAVKRIANFLSFAVSSLSEWRWARGADVIYVYATPMTAAIAPRIWRKLFGTPYILHVQDLWPESVTDSGMLGNGRVSALVRKLLDVFLGWIYDGAEHTVTIAPNMAQTLRRRGIPGTRLSVALNWADEENLTQVDRVHNEKGLRVVYAGNMGRFQDVTTIIQAAKLVDDLPDIHIDLYGDGTELAGLRRLAKDLHNVTFHGRVAREHMHDVYARSDFQLVTLMDLPLFRGTIPSKFQGSMAAGVPIITSVKGDLSDLVRQHELGLVVEPQSAESLAAGLRRAHEMSAGERTALGINAKSFYEKKMSFNATGTKIKRILTAASRSNHTNRFQTHEELGRVE